MKRKFLAIASLLFCAIILFNFSSCVRTVRAENLMNGIKAEEVEKVNIDNDFKIAQTNFAVNLLEGCNKEDKKENLLISPLSVTLALAMTANGANGQTKEQMEKVLGGNLKIEKINEYIYSYVNGLYTDKDNKINIANSIWLREDKKFTVKESFLQTNANYYGAQIYKSAFDEKTVKDINNWAYNHTSGMINKIVESISEETIAYLINALTFDAKWQSIYKTEQISNGIFTAQSGEEQQVKMMHSTEYGYVQTAQSEGFIKNYKNSKYAFVALLPNEGVGIDEFISNLTAEELVNALEYGMGFNVIASIPKFEYDYSVTLNGVLKDMGIDTAFSPTFADFSNLGSYENANIYIANVLHKTHISVAEKGTKAGAITVVEMGKDTSMPTEKVITLNRPFVYLIVDKANNLPLFIGALKSVN